jgi:hypothetical protein
MGINSGRLEPSLLPVVAHGLDLSRTVPGKAWGVHQADEAAEFLAGQVVARDANGKIVKCTGLGAMGIAKWNKAAKLSGIAIQEAIVLTGTGAVALKHPVVSQVKVEKLDGTDYALTTDYLLNATNGTVSRVGAGAIADGETVLVSYRYDVLPGTLDFEGRNFFNFIDDVSIAQNRITVIQGFSIIFSAAYDSSKDYAIGDALTCGADGYVTKGGAGDVVGKVIQVPTAQDPFLGYELSL